MTPTLWTFDLLLALALVGLAAGALSTRDLFKGVVLFIVFGLTMAVVWTRLHAVDIALAEAAIGAGLTGALFLNALGQMRSEREQDAAPPTQPGTATHALADKPPVAPATDAPADKPPVAPGTGAMPVAPGRMSAAARGALGVLLLALGAVLGAVVWQIPREAEGLGPSVEAAIELSGVTNPVTAVLLNFRSYDTLLEIGVLLIGVVGVWSFGFSPATATARAPMGPVLFALVRVLVPLVILVAAYLLWVGSKAPGGAFQAGAVLGAAGVLLVVAEKIRPPGLTSRAARWVWAAGFAGFLLVGGGMTALGRGFLEYPPQWAPSLILLVEALLTVSIGATLFAMFTGGPASEMAEETRPLPDAAQPEDQP